MVAQDDLSDFYPGDKCPFCLSPPISIYNYWGHGSSLENRGVTMFYNCKHNSKKIIFRNGKVWHLGFRLKNYTFTLHYVNKEPETMVIEGFNGIYNPHINLTIQKHVLITEENYLDVIERIKNLQVFQ